ncbi:MAG: YraN family protein [Candidatus Acidiferrales bacterium]
MPIFARMIYGLVSLASRKGLSDEASDGREAAGRKGRARGTGIRGETFAYWYLRRHGYVMIARNFTAPGMKGEVDLVGYDGAVLAFIEVKTRTAADKEIGLPEDAVNLAKRRNLTRMARRFLADSRVPEAKCRFDVLAIESRRGQKPVVRLHKDAFTPRS